MPRFVKSKQGGLPATLNAAGVGDATTAPAVTAALKQQGAVQDVVAGETIASIAFVLSDQKEEERLAGLKIVKVIADAHGAMCSDQLVDLLPAIFGMYVSFLLSSRSISGYTA